MDNFITILLPSLSILTARLSVADKIYDVAMGSGVKIPCTSANDPTESSVQCPTVNVNYTWTIKDDNGQAITVTSRDGDDPRSLSSRYYVDLSDGSLHISVTGDARMERTLFQCKVAGVVDGSSCFYKRTLRYRKCGDEIVHKSGHVSLCKFGTCEMISPYTGHSQLKCRCQPYATGYFCDEIILDSAARQYHTPYIPFIAALMLITLVVFSSFLCGCGNSRKVLAYGKHEEKRG
uniref:Ig-like domain-containing protein n=1 Tax=Romanomermis culicivorax TaxID=13658 RepID=A0A915JDM8_ROMCU